MDGATRLERLLPLAGALYATLTVLAAAAFPLPPGGDVSPGRKPAWLAAHHGAALAQGYVRALGALAFVVLALAVAHALRRRGGSQLAVWSALAGGVATGLALLVSQALEIASALAAGGGAGAAAVRSLGYGEDGVLTLSSLPAVVLFAAAGAAFLRQRLVPSWVAWLTLAGVPIALLDAASYDGGPLAGVGFLGLLYFLVWSLVVGVTLAARATTDDRPTIHLDPGREAIT